MCDPTIPLHYTKSSSSSSSSPLAPTLPFSLRPLPSTPLPLELSHSARINVFDIPELLLRICSFLTQEELLQCILLSKCFHSLCIPLLYSDISITNPFQFHRFKSPSTLNALIRNAFHIRSFKTRYLTILQCLLPSAVDCRNLTNIQLPRPCRFSDPEIPRGFYVDVAAAAPHDESQLILGAVGGDHTVNYGSENIAGIVALDMVTRARNGVGLFDETFLISLMDKCPRLSTFVMVGFPFDHDQLIRQIGDRLAQPRATTSTATAPTPIVSDTVSDLTGSASALTITQPTGLKKLELTNLYYCRVRAKSIEYLLSHCTSEMEELLLSISFGSRADLGDGDGDDEDGIQGVEQEQEQSGSGTGHSSVVTQACPPCFEDDGREWKLWRLVIKGDLSGQGPLIWLPLLRKCSNLQEICIDVFKHGTIEHLAQTLSQCCPKVSEITLQCMTGGPQEDSVIAALIQSSRSWRRLSISFLHGFGPLSIGALIRHSATLETLILEECDGIYSEDIQGVLSSCVNLKTFRAMTSNGVDFSSTVYLDAADMMEDPWVCLGLENLKLVIVGVARPDLQEDQYGEPLLGPLHDGSITEPELQRVVYRQLGKLTRLRELWLGHDKQDLDDEDNYHPTDVEGQWQFIDPDEQFECLDFSLKSGLSLLSGLSDLRVLNIDRMKTRIGLSEVQWMVKQWPKLERIIGLVIQGENVPKHVQWLYDNRPDIELPPVLGHFITGF